MKLESGNWLKPSLLTISHPVGPEKWHLIPCGLVLPPTDIPESEMKSLWRPACLRVLLPMLTLALSLGVILVVVLRLPVEELGLASTDTRLLEGFSPFWCGQQEVTSTHPFYAYKVAGEPAVNNKGSRLHSFAFRFTLKKGHFHFLRYHLLEGSSLETSGCSSDGEATMDVVYSGDPFDNCWKNVDRGLRSTFNVARKTDNLDYDNEDSSSEEESDESVDVNYSKDGFKKLKAWKGQASSLNRPCPVSLSSNHFEELPDHSYHPYPTCQSSFDAEKRVNITRSGIYYIVVRTSDSEAVNHLLLHVRLNRTSYDLPEDLVLCRSESRCEIPLTFGSMERVVVFMSAEPDAGSVIFPVRSKCKPRIIYLSLPLLFLVALAGGIHVVRRKKVTRRFVALEEQEANRNVSRRVITDGHYVTAVTSAPLLVEEEDKKLSDGAPPPYVLVSELPPSYDVVVSQGLRQP